MKLLYHSNKRGVALVEAALAIPLLLMLFLGILFGSLGFTSYAITSLDVVTAYVAKDAFDYDGTLKQEHLVHGHQGNSYLNVPETDEKGLIFANLVSGRADLRRDPFGTPTDDQVVTYAYSSASKERLVKKAGADRLYTVNRTFMPWIRGMEFLAVKSSVLGVE
jgi:hypothetical protein